jgi:hypothetical protein
VDEFVFPSNHVVFHDVPPLIDYCKQHGITLFVTVFPNGGSASTRRASSLFPSTAPCTTSAVQARAERTAETVRPHCGAPTAGPPAPRPAAAGLSFPATPRTPPASPPRRRAGRRTASSVGTGTGTFLRQPTGHSIQVRDWPLPGPVTGLPPTATLP